MPNRQSLSQKKFQCDFCPARNSKVRVIKVRESKHLMCVLCIAELAKQCRKEKLINDARALAEKLFSADPANPNRGTGNNPAQTESPTSES